MNHVNKNVLLGISVATLLMLGVVVWLSQADKKAEPSKPAYALPSLNGHINELKSVSISGAQNKVLVTLDNSEQGWTVREKAAYPADIDTLRKLLLGLADAKLLESKTADPQRYAEIGVQDLSSADAKGVGIKLEGLSQPEQLIVGVVSSQGNGTFVRRPGETQSWLANGQISIATDPKQWLNTTLTDIPAERLAEVVLTKAGAKPLRLRKAKPDQTNFEVANLPAGRELLAPGVVNSLASTLMDLTLEEISAAETQSTEKPALQAHFRTFDGVVIDIVGWQQDAKYSLSLKATFDTAAADEAVTAAREKPAANADQSENPQTANNAKPGKPAKPTLDSLRAEVELLNQRFHDRVFQIPAYKYQNLNKSMEDILKSLATPAKAKPSSKKPGADSSHLNGGNDPISRRKIA